LEADGVRLEGVACKVDGAMGLLGSLVIAAGFAKRRAQLDACTHGKPQRTTVAWTAAGGVMSKVKADGRDARTARCVEKALSGRVMNPGTRSKPCSARRTSGVSARKRRRAICASSRASAAPRQKCGPKPKETWRFSLRVMSKRPGSGNTSGSRLAAPARK